MGFSLHCSSQVQARFLSNLGQCVRKISCNQSLRMEVQAFLRLTKPHCTPDPHSSADVCAKLYSFAAEPYLLLYFKGVCLPYSMHVLFSTRLRHCIYPPPLPPPPGENGCVVGKPVQIGKESHKIPRKLLYNNTQVGAGPCSLQALKEIEPCEWFVAQSAGLIDERRGNFRRAEVEVTKMVLKKV